jgi:hypothetical protein
LLYITSIRAYAVGSPEKEIGLARRELHRRVTGLSVRVHEIVIRIVLVHDALLGIRHGVISDTAQLIKLEIHNTHIVVKRYFIF